MPPLSAYTPFESLLFFQSLASLESRPASFLSISELLRNNPFIRQNAAFNPDRLSPEALEDLYTTLIRDGLASGPNGHSANPSTSNPRKRKISSPRPDGLVDGVARHSRMVPELVAHLYASYKELVTREIRQEEKLYGDIRDEVDRLQKEERGIPLPPQLHEGPRKPQEASQVQGPEPMDIDVKEEEPAPQPVVEVNRYPVEPIEQPQRPLPQAAQQQQPVHQHQQAPVQVQQPFRPPQPIPHIQADQPQPQQVNGKQPQQLAPAPRNPPVNASPAPLASPPDANADPSRVPTTPALQPPNGSNTPSVPQVAPVPTPPAQNIGQGPPAAPPGRPPQSHHQPQPSFQKWPLNSPAPQTPQPSFSPYGHPQYPGKTTSGKPFQLPIFQQAPQTEPKSFHKPYSPAPATPGSRSQLQSPAPSGVGGYDTPFGGTQARGFRPHRRSIETPGSVTPWKRNTPRLSIPESPTSPNRPRPEDVSPISERAPSPFEPPEPAAHSRHRKNKTSVDVTDGGSKPRSRAGRKKRDESTASSRSRGRSLPSRDTTSPDSASASQAKIKHEMPSTPAGFADVEPEPRTAGRKSQTDERPGRGRPKRKRQPSEVIEPENLQAEINRMDPAQSAQYVLTARNFPRTSQPIMNDVLLHKHASTFTKPLSERDAPGYRDLIYRPQDLKSIKSLITQGSKAVSAATEAASTPAGDGESPAPSGTPSKNAVLMLPKTEDVIPPKAVVNSTQLEKELIRMFANAIMFNPIPQRGFGHSFPMTSDSRSRESTQVPDADEGGIIKDTLEMFEDVEQAVTRWRAAERTADELASKSVLSLRRGSELNTDGAEDSKEL